MFNASMLYFAIFNAFYLMLNASVLYYATCIFNAIYNMYYAAMLYHALNYTI